MYECCVVYQNNKGMTWLKIEEDKYMSGEVYQFIGKKFTIKADKNYKNFSDDWREIF